MTRIINRLFRLCLSKELDTKRGSGFFDTSELYSSSMKLILVCI